MPADWFEAVGEGEIRLAADRAMPERLPEYRPAHPDARITADVRRALAADVRTRGEPRIDVRTDEGVVRLSGAVGTEEAKQAAAEVAGGVPPASGRWSRAA